MTNNLRVVLAQMNLTVGDISTNLQKHIEAANTARKEYSADIIVFPELSLTGYPPEDLLLRPSFIEDTKKALKTFIREVKDIYCIIGHPHEARKNLHNACSVIYNGKIIARYAKQRLPNYGVFDEARYFKPGESSCVIPIKNIPIGIVICEDLWSPRAVQEAVAHGAKIIFSPNASPFEINKHEARMNILSKRAIENKVPVAYVNMACGQDEIVFDGGSMVINQEGNIAALADFFTEKLLPVDIKINSTSLEIEKSAIPVLPTHEERTYQALTFSLREYVNKNNFPGVILGLSGGIDSALTLAIAVDALGSDKVHAVIMPSRYTADISIDDAKEIANNLNVSYEIISIEPSHQAFINSLTPSFANKKPDITEENIQARCRAILLMALSNKFGYLVLTTGNRSELAVGYCTLYGDMAGGFAVLKDVSKTLVYQLAKYRNKISRVIPERTIQRAPTAELAPDQKDEDSLPPYSILDEILELYLNKCFSPEEIIAQGFEKNTVEKIVKLIHRNEYKRKQAAIGTHINHKSFIKDWRYPITNKYKK